jgi:hypothetical protein
VSLRDIWNGMGADRSESPHDAWKTKDHVAELDIDPPWLQTTDRHVWVRVEGSDDFRCGKCGGLESKARFQCPTWGWP